ncbi:MAG: Rieske (2Fe-2S) protein, partial [Pseudomonadota bacterium]
MKGIFRSRKTSLAGEAEPSTQSAEDAPAAAALTWYKVAELDELPPGRVKSASAGLKTVALCHFDGQYAALDNRCPHQGGPLG